MYILHGKWKRFFPILLGMNILISRKELTDTFFSSKPLPMISVKVRTVHGFQQIDVWYTLLYAQFVLKKQIWRFLHHVHFKTKYNPIFIHFFVALLIWISRLDSWIDLSWCLGKKSA